jgi:hypothetical protein
MGLSHDMGMSRRVTKSDDLEYDLLETSATSMRQN